MISATSVPTVNKKPPSAAANVPKPRTTRAQLEHDILDAAKKLFAQRGYGGVSLDHIAKAVGASKQNLLYYFPSKEALYRRVLHGVLDVWLLYMDNLSQR